MKRLLADRMRPETMNEYVGQQHIIGEGKLLRRAIEADLLRSIILTGPPGTGKTSLANVISKVTDCRFVKLDATEAKISDLRDVIEMAKNMLQGTNRKTIVFIDEIHRFKSNQQDVLLPSVEDGTIILIGATTENPYFEVNSALISRSTIFQLKPLEKEDIVKALLKAANSEKGLYEYLPIVTTEAYEHIADVANGDLRTAYNALELAVLTTKPDDNGVRVIDLAIAEDSIQRRAVRYDKGATEHYNIFSAFSKSLRGCATSASLYYMARMVEAGEDPKAIMRRVIAHASEDVGLANPQVLLTAIAAAQALDYVGWPEARLPMAQAIILLCESPKSNSVYNAINSAISDVKHKKLDEIPVHIRDDHDLVVRELGGREKKGYIYPHSIPGNYTPNQEYLPENLVGVDYYKPSNNGYEVNIKKFRNDRKENYDKLRG